MRCHICDNNLSSVVYNADHDDFDPCGTCLEVIHNVFKDGDKLIETFEDPFEEDTEADPNRIDVV